MFCEAKCMAVWSTIKWTAVTQLRDDIHVIETIAIDWSHLTAIYFDYADEIYLGYSGNELPAATVCALCLSFVYGYIVPTT